MPRRNSRLDALKSEIPPLLRAIQDGSKLPPGEFRGIVRAQVLLKEDAMRKQWRRWLSGETLPGVQTLHVIVSTATQRDWLNEKDLARLGARPLVAVIHAEAESMRSKNASRLRKTTSFLASAKGLVRRLDRMVDSSTLPRAQARQVATLAVLKLAAERMGADFGPRDIDIPLDMARVFNELMNDVVQGIFEQQRRLLQEMHEEQAAEIQDVRMFTRPRQSFSHR